MKAAEIIGHNIKKLREDSNIKQEALARHINIGKSRMSQIESGDCGELTINRIAKIAEYLKIDFFEFTKSEKIQLQEVAKVNPQANITQELIQKLANELAYRMIKK